jgi:hypothetical protein
MNFKEEYTTQAKIDADTEGTEAKKTILSNDAFAVSSLIDALITKIEHTRLSLIK